MTQKIILDIDNALTLPAQDTDDAIALALALVSPELELVGITTCAGNCRTPQSTRNTLRLLEAAGAAGIPVAEGRAAPFLRDRRNHFRYLEQKSAGPQGRYWRDLPTPTPVESKAWANPAHEFIHQALARFPDELIYVALGSLTNLALALLTAPAQAPRIKQVVHMGGSFQPPAGPPFVWSTPDIPDDVWETTLRFNTAFDPEASAVVFRAGIPLTFVTANVTCQVFQRPAHLDRLQTAGTPFHHFLHTYTRPWVTWSMAERRLPGAHMHDPLAVALIIDPTFCRLETLFLDEAAFLKGQAPWLVHDPVGTPVQVATAVDAGRFEAFLAARLTHPVRPIYQQTSRWQKTS
ncbi:MAG: nucleoside hydrolase [Desulfobacterales bacterium]|nr:nucleoside hydrolase [Desulfobacterales bacterium]